MKILFVLLEVYEDCYEDSGLFDVSVERIHKRWKCEMLIGRFAARWRRWAEVMARAETMPWAVAVVWPARRDIFVKQEREGSVASEMAGAPSPFINILIGALNHSHYPIRPRLLCGAGDSRTNEFARCFAHCASGTRTRDLSNLTTSPTSVTTKLLPLLPLENNRDG